MDIYKRLSVYLKGYWRIFAVAIVAMIVVATTAPTFAYLRKLLTNEGFVEKTSIR
ncbi:hypothetical protein L0B52_05520 [Suttonella sp. R2A3]|uniref:hypothetical protein n=1 Tax=Suttonella sp. R2A3 TaxID=2908648 RepID=UPI001F26C97C|nr:hypothetical protein [Suttonella sp. R2A3]UJF23809.1 hypothetical protein L0B52_05520 [Suttonella sp. R2A3]